jgi:hypothetical protein
MRYARCKMIREMRRSTNECKHGRDKNSKTGAPAVATHASPSKEFNRASLSATLNQKLQQQNAHAPIAVRQRHLGIADVAVADRVPQRHKPALLVVVRGEQIEAVQPIDAVATRVVRGRLGHRRVCGWDWEFGKEMDCIE